MKLKINQEPYEKGVKIFNNNELVLKDGVTVLIGRNGVGKSTLLMCIAEYCRDHNIHYYKYDNYKDGGERAREGYGFAEDFKSLAQTMFQSEGQQIFYNFGKQVENISKFVRGHTEDKKLFILLDALDSGLDIDGILQIKDVFRIIAKDCAEHDIKLYAVLSSNNYSLVEGEQCLDTRELKYVNIPNYEAYKNFIIQQYETERAEKE